MARLIKFHCQGCGTKLAVPPQMAGMTDHCPKCGSMVTSPTLDEWRAKLEAAGKAAPVSAEKKADVWSPAELAEALNPPLAAAVPEMTLKAGPVTAPQAKPPEPVLAPAASQSLEPPLKFEEAKPAVVSKTLLQEEARPLAAVAAGAKNDELHAHAAPSIVSRMRTSTGLAGVAGTAAVPRKEPKWQEKAPFSFQEKAEQAPQTGQLTNREKIAPREEEIEPFGDDRADADASLNEEPGGLGEVLAAVSSASKAMANREAPPWRATPFLSGPEASNGEARRRKRRKVGVVIAVIVVVEVVVASLVWAFKRQIVEWWHGESVVAPAVVEPAAATEVTPPESNKEGTTASEAAAAAPTGEEDSPDAFAMDEGTAVTSDGATASAAAAFPNDTAGASVSASESVPAAIPISEEDLVKLMPAGTPNAVDNGGAAKAAGSNLSEGEKQDVAPDKKVGSSENPQGNKEPLKDQWPAKKPADDGASPDSPEAFPVKTVELVEVQRHAEGLPPSAADMALPDGSPPTPKTLVVAETTPSEIEIADDIRVGDVPPEAESALTALRHFLRAADWKTRARYSLRQGILNRAMEKHAREYGDGPIRVGEIEFVERYAKNPGVPPYSMFGLTGGTLPHRVLAIVEQPKGGPALVDWEAFMEFRHDFLLKFLETEESPPQSFRVMLRRKHYFDHDVPNLGAKDSFQITQPNLNYEGHVFLAKESELGNKLANQLPWGTDMLVIVQLVWKNNGTNQWVEIKDIPRYGWRSS